MTKRVVEEIYMQIEFPEGGPIAFFRGETFPTVGDFYDAVLAAFSKLQASEITGARQITRGQRLFAINTVVDAERAINRIKRQGGGTSQSPFSDDFETNLAHYYRFAEIFHERRLIKTSDRSWKYEGDALPFPEVFPMTEVPPGGYPDEEKALEFNRSYMTMPNHLQRAWEDGNGGELSNAVGVMFELEGPARELMQKPIPRGSGNYGPD